MAETVHAEPSKRPDADAYRRAGLTAREAARRERAERWRAGTQSPWEASPAGLAVWLLWRAVLKGFQPLWLLASLLLAGWFGLQWLASVGGVSAVAGPQPGEAERVRAAIAAAVPAGIDARDFWTDRLEAALDGDRRRRPDIDRFRAWAALGPDLIGRERLALEALAGPVGPRALDARLRAGPPQVREARLSQAFHARLAEGEAGGLVPPELVFAGDALQQRYARSQFEWSVAQTSAAAFFRGRRGGEFEMRSLSGLVAEDVAGPTRLYGGVRHLAMQACAHAADRLSGCEARIIPGERPDGLRYGLAALESGLVQLHIPSSAVRTGAEVLQGARLAGRLTPALEAEIAAVLETALPAETVTARLAGTGARMDIAFAAPDRAEQDLVDAIDRRTADGAVALSELLRDLARIRDDTSPAVAMRLVAGLDRIGDVQRLRQLAGLLGERTLAVRELMGADALALVEREPEQPAGDPIAQRNAMLALISAGLVLLLTLIRLMTPAPIRRASRLSLADAWISRLTLGRKT
ncbi:hypothetical protein [Maricaulis sp.]|uniref:hypothetical protein n=1 Tax=Maricaulis sp. TaxID=1486257 RepID=UPI002619C7E7|nr:hypothetical protein [Maricaulis sp.]